MAIVTENESAAEAENQAASQPQQQQRTRNTQQRRAVLDAVRALNGAHPTAAEVYERLRGEYPSLSLATVYRALHVLVEQKAVTELYVGGNGENVARFDGGAHPHHHLVCRVCGGIHDLGPEVVAPALLRRLERRIEKESEFRIDSAHPIQFSGVCPGCRA